MAMEYSHEYNDCHPARNDSVSINSKMLSSRQYDYDVTDQDLASMKLMIQDIRQNPDLLYRYSNIPYVSLRGAPLPDLGSITNTQQQKTRSLFRSKSTESDAKSSIASKIRDLYFCQECSSSMIP